MSRPMALPLNRKMDQWTTQQWGNHHVDIVAKNYNTGFCDTYISWPVFSAPGGLDKAKAHHHWHCGSKLMGISPLNHSAKLSEDVLNLTSPI